MSITLGTVALLSLILGAIGTGTQMIYNSAEANKNRQFQQEMRDTSLISSVNQAKELGISPSLVLGQSSSAVGGSQAMSNSNMASGVNDAITDYIKQDRYLDTLERMNNAKLNSEETKAMIYATKGKFRSGTNATDPYDNLFDDISKIDIRGLRK